jgi:hypothetical protein
VRIQSAKLVVAAFLIASTIPVSAQMGGMNMTKPEGPAHFTATREAYTTNHEFLVKLTSVPNPIPFERYFTLRFVVYDGSDPSKKIADSRVAVLAGMRHGMTTGFAHGMQSSPKVKAQNGSVTVSGMYFHMMGPWTLKVTVHGSNESGVAYFELPCCGR